MTDTDKLKRLKKEIKRKEFWRETRDSRDYVIHEICDADDYGAEERYVYSDWLRESILALIAENERLKDAASVLTMRYGEVNAENNRIDAIATDLQSKHDVAVMRLSEAVALLREIIRTGVEETCEHGDQREAMRRISLLIDRIDGANNNVP